MLMTKQLQQIVINPNENNLNSTPKNVDMKNRHYKLYLPSAVYDY